MRARQDNRLQTGVGYTTELGGRDRHKFFRRPVEGSNEDFVEVAAASAAAMLPYPSDEAHRRQQQQQQQHDDKESTGSAALASTCHAPHSQLEGSEPDSVRSRFRISREACMMHTAPPAMTAPARVGPVVTMRSTAHTRHAHPRRLPRLSQDDNHNSSNTSKRATIGTNCGDKYGSTNNGSENTNNTTMQCDAEQQTDYCEREVQTDPYTPDYILPGSIDVDNSNPNIKNAFHPNNDGGGSEPLILQLQHLTWSSGLPAGGEEVALITRLRRRRALEAEIDNCDAARGATMSVEAKLAALGALEQAEWEEREAHAARLRTRRVAAITSALRARDAVRESMNQRRLSRLRESEMTALQRRLSAMATRMTRHTTRRQRHVALSRGGSSDTGGAGGLYNTDEEMGCNRSRRRRYSIGGAAAATANRASHACGADCCNTARRASKSSMSTRSSRSVTHEEDWKSDLHEDGFNEKGWIARYARYGRDAAPVWPDSARLTSTRVLHERNKSTRHSTAFRSSPWRTAPAMPLSQAARVTPSHAQLGRSSAEALLLRARYDIRPALLRWRGGAEVVEGGGAARLGRLSEATFAVPVDAALTQLPTLYQRRAAEQTRRALDYAHAALQHRAATLPHTLSLHHGSGHGYNRAVDGADQNAVRRVMSAAEGHAVSDGTRKEEREALLARYRAPPRIARPDTPELQFDPMDEEGGEEEEDEAHYHKEANDTKSRTTANAGDVEHSNNPNVAQNLQAKRNREHDGDAVDEAALLLQRLLRGRAVQNDFFDGKERCRGLIAELQVASSTQFVQRGRMAAVRAEAQLREAQRSMTDSLIHTAAGSAIAETTSYLLQELTRARDAHRLSYLRTAAEEVQRHRELAEANRRARQRAARDVAEVKYRLCSDAPVTATTVELMLREVYREAVDTMAMSVAMEQERQRRRDLVNRPAKGQTAYEEVEEGGHGAKSSSGSSPCRMYRGSTDDGCTRNETDAVDEEEHDGDDASSGSASSLCQERVVCDMLDDFVIPTVVRAVGRRVENQARRAPAAVAREMANDMPLS